MAAVAGVLLMGKAAGRFSSQTLTDLSMGRLTEPGPFLANALIQVPRQLLLLWMPHRQSPEYALHDVGPGDPAVVLGGLLLLVWALAAVLLVRRRPLIGFAAAWTLVTWLPTANLIPLGPFFVAERYLYVASWGVCLLIALALTRLAAWRAPVAYLISMMLIGAATLQSRAYLSVWRDDAVLWQTALDHGQPSHRAHAVLGTLAYGAGDLATAVDQLQRAHELVPAGLETRIKLMIALADAGRFQDALVHARQVSSALPGQADANRILGMAALLAADHRTAADRFTRYLDSRPEDVDALNNLAWLLAASPDDSLRDGPRALLLAGRACSLGKRQDANHLATLSMALAENGKFAEALAVLDEAGARVGGQDRLVAFIDALRRRYRAGQPYRAGR